MPPFSSEDSARAQIRQQQIIIASLAMGQIIFAGIAIGNRLQKPPELATVISYTALGMGVIMLLVRMIVGSTMAAGQRRKIAAGTWTVPAQARGHLPFEMSDNDKLLVVLQAKTIVEGAVLEGAGFFAIIAYLVEGHVWTLAVAGLLLTMLLISFPSYERAERWVKYQLELSELEKGRQ